MLAGLAGGGLSGMAGAGVSQTLIPELGKAINELDLPQAAKQALIQVAAIGMGVAVGGAVGAASAQNATSQNYLTPRENLERNRAQADCLVGNDQACQRAAQLNVLDQRRDQELAKAAQACNAGDMNVCHTLNQTLRQWAWQGQTELAQMSKELAPICAPPKDCANAANWVNHELKGLQQVSNGVWAASSSGAVQPTGGPELLFVGGTLGALRLSAAGFGLGAGFDAAGQLVTNGTIRPEQSLVAGMTGAVGVPLAVRGNLWVPVAGAGAAAANTTFNNFYYGESTNAWVAGGLGAGAALLDPYMGAYAQRAVTPWITNAPRIPATGSTYIPVQNRLPNVPVYVGNSVNQMVTNSPSFIPLDNGKRTHGGKP